MFVLVKLRDTIRIAPEKFILNPVDAISEELNSRLANRVLVNTGLCICLYDILEVGQAFIYQGDGASHSKGLWLLVICDHRFC